MARRPVFVPAGPGEGWVRVVALDFEWHPGLSRAQMQRSIASLHRSAAAAGLSPALEISSKSPEPLGVELSAFNLRLSVDGGRRVTVEGAYQGSKVFAGGGPYTDLFDVPGRDAKLDPRVRTGGPLTAFEFGRVRWPTEPRTVFYDWLYLRALSENPALAEPLTRYAAFTDIVFNPAKSINCQAHAAALYVALRRAGVVDTAVRGPGEMVRLVSGEGNTGGRAQPDLFG